MKIYHNDLDQTLIVCKNCVEFVNDDSIDDRDFYHSPEEYNLFITSCELCGEWSDGGEL